MIDSISAVLHFLLTSLGVVANTAPGTMTAFAVALVAAAIVTVMLVTLASPPTHHSSLTRPRRAIDVSVLLSQSDPDAAGHPRSRAPGFAAPAA